MLRLTDIQVVARDTNLYTFARRDGGTAAGLQARRSHRPASAERHDAAIFAGRSRSEPDSYAVGIKRDANSRGGSRYIIDEMNVGDDAQDQRAAQQFPVGRGRRACRAVCRRHRHHADLVHGAAACRARSFLEAQLRLPLTRRHGVSRRRWKNSSRNTLICISTTKPAEASRSRRGRRRGADECASVLLRPEPDAQGVRGRDRGRPRKQVHFEYFTPKEEAATADSRRLLGRARALQRGIFHPAGQDLLQMLYEAGVDVDYSCELASAARARPR